VAGAVVAGVLAEDDGTAVVLEPGDREVAGPGAAPWLPHPVASTARHAAAARTTDERVVIMSPLSLEIPFLQNPGSSGRTIRGQSRWS